MRNLRAWLACSLAVLTLPGCTHVATWAGVHAEEIAAVGLVAGTAVQVEGALVNADELARRAERRIEDAERK